MGVGAFLEPIIRDPRVYMVHVVKPDIAGKPLERARQAKIRSTSERGRGKTPACLRHPLRMLKAVLDRKQPDADDRGDYHDRQLDGGDTPLPDTQPHTAPKIAHA